MTIYRAVPADEVAAMIREVDGDNRMSPSNLGATLASRLCVWKDGLNAVDVIAFVDRTNPDKQMGAARLAELIVAEFRLGGE